MGYSSVDDVEKVVAQALSSATTPTTTSTRSLLEIGRVFDQNLVPTDVVEWYIARADEEINSYLSQLYKVPLCELADFESSLLADLDEYNTFIILTQPCPLNPGDIIILKYRTIEERHEIEAIIAEDTYSTVDPIQFAFSAGTRVVRVKFPEPIRIVSARMSAANVYDKHFAAQVSPNISDYGKYMREQSRTEMSNILNGRTILHGQHRIGRRFWNPNLDDRYALPSLSDSPRDLDRLEV
jgi:hypothetical protein|tara:strand:+ start:3556 stop:4275 length:720 start_codon:yes stop_codon:yes gene_type:complete